MGQVIISSSGVGGTTSDELTSTAGYVVKGKTYVGADTDDEAGTGTLELTGSVTNAHVLAGDTYYSTNPNNKQTGTMANIAAIDPMKSMTMSGGTVYVRISNGAHITNASSGYPEVSIDGSNFGDAIDAYVYKGKTYTCSTGIKRTGTMTCSSILSFKVAAYSTTQLLCTWTNPTKGPYSGVIICAQTGSYPSNKDTNRKYTGIGGNATANGTCSAIISGLTAGTTYYVRVWAYTTCSVGNFYSGYTSATCKTTTSGRKAFTSSGTFTIPSGVRSININAVAAGGSGHQATKSSAYFVTAGGGGGGGGITYQKNISVAPGNVVTFTIGAGGTNTNPSSSSATQTGGNTIVSINNTAKTLITANGGHTAHSEIFGGSGGASGTTGSAGGGGGKGADLDSGKGEDGSVGANGGYEFGNASSTRYCGGGGGGGGQIYDSQGTEKIYTYYGKSGGDRGGGQGGNQNSAGTNGAAGTGGGGGGGGMDSGAGGTGGCGCVVITW